MNSVYVTIEPEMMLAWGRAVGAQFYALGQDTPEAWAHAGRAWDALAALQSPVGHDRGIYLNLAVEAWYKAAFLKSPSAPPEPIFQTPARGVRYPEAHP